MSNVVETYFVLDASCCRDGKYPPLESYLRERTENKVVIVPTLGVESHKGTDPNYNLKRSLDVISEFPKQVVILKPTGYIIYKELRRNDLPHGLFELESTSGFDTYCNQTLHSRDERIIRQIVDRGKDANDYLQLCRDEVSKMIPSIDEIRRRFDARERDILSNAFNDDGFILKETQLLLKVYNIAIPFAYDLGSRRFSSFTSLSKDDKLIQLGFREGIGIFMVLLKWAARGGYEQLKPEKLRNDTLDASYSTFATYFDGIMTLDKGLLSTYQLTKACLNFFQRLKI